MNIYRFLLVVIGVLIWWFQLANAKFKDSILVN
jgi:hypothetical protein